MNTCTRERPGNSLILCVAMGEWVTTGRQGAEHLRALTALVHKTASIVPIYLVTAWGSPIIEDETLPVYGGYAYPDLVVDRPSAVPLINCSGMPYARRVDSAQRLVIQRTNRLVYAGCRRACNPLPAIARLYRLKASRPMALVPSAVGSNWIGTICTRARRPGGGHGFSHERLHPTACPNDYQGPSGRVRYICMPAMLTSSCFTCSWKPTVRHLPDGTMCDSADAVRPEDTENPCATAFALRMARGSCLSTTSRTMARCAITMMWCLRNQHVRRPC